MMKPNREMFTLWIRDQYTWSFHDQAEDLEKAREKIYTWLGDYPEVETRKWVNTFGEVIIMLDPGSIFPEEYDILETHERYDQRYIDLYLKLISEGVNTDMYLEYCPLCKKDTVRSLSYRDCGCIPHRKATK